MPRAPKHCAHTGCEELTRERYCPTHKAQAQARDNTTHRGYGAQHQARRAKLLPAAYGKQCELCGELMLPVQALHADHSTPLAHDQGSVADRITHAHCNTSAGGATRRQKRT